MNIIEIDTRDKKQTEQFLNLPFRIYQDTPQWVPPLEVEIRRMLDQRRHPYYRHSKAAFFLAIEKGEPVGRIAVLDNRIYNDYNREATAFFYLFESFIDEKIALALFEAAFIWARQHGLNNILGPKGFSVFDGLGLLTKGFEHRPAFGLPYNRPEYPALIESAGFVPCGELVSGYLHVDTPFPEKIHLISTKLQQRRGFKVIRFKSRHELRSIVSNLRELYNASLTGTTGTAPITPEEAQTLANQILWFADPRLIKVVYKGSQAVGFLFAYPDISAAVQRTRGRIFPLGWIDLLLEMRRTKWININGAAMIEGFRGLGGTALLFSEIQKSIQEGNYQHADLVQVGVENGRMLRELKDFGVNFYKIHRIYKRQL